MISTNIILFTSDVSNWFTTSYSGILVTLSKLNLTLLFYVKVKYCQTSELVAQNHRRKCDHVDMIQTEDDDTAEPSFSFRSMNNCLWIKVILMWSCLQLKGQTGNINHTKCRAGQPLTWTQTFGGNIDECMWDLL